MQDMPQWMGIVIAAFRKTTNAALLVRRQNQHLSFLRTTAGLGLSRGKVFANNAQTKKSTNGKKGIEMNTTHTSEPIEQKEKQKAARLLDELDLRDYFAAKAMQGMCVGAPVPQKGEIKLIATRSYEMADAMLEAREA
jgi:hypothetical protein